MATIYLPDKLLTIIVKHTEQQPVTYLKELVEKDIKEKGWDKQ